jgi:serine/threonine-protein kinase
LLTGRTVFKAGTVPLMLMHHIKDGPDPPSKHVPDVIPAALDGLILECLEKDKDARPQSASALEQRLAAISETEWSREELREWWDRHCPPRTDTSDPLAFESTYHLPVA